MRIIKLLSLLRKQVGSTASDLDLSHILGLLHVLILEGYYPIDCPVEAVIERRILDRQLAVLLRIGAHSFQIDALVT
jgi:hypothetical protein